MTALAGVLFCVSRNAWAAGYATGEPMNRYKNSSWGRHIWTALVVVMGTAVSASFGILGVF